jgi:hypothetical protein
MRVDNYAEFLQVLCVPVQTPPGNHAFVWLPSLTLISGKRGCLSLQQIPDAMQTAAELPALCSAETTNLTNLATQHHDSNELGRLRSASDRIYNF